MRDRRTLTFILLAGCCVIAAVVAAITAVSGGGQPKARPAQPAALKVLAGRAPFVAFRVLDRDDGADYTRLAVATLTPEGPGRALPAGPSCVRVTYRAATGLCLGQPGATSFPIQQLNARMKQVHAWSMPGVPSRARISPDGHWGGITAFIAGHSYAQPGQFSTAATILDLRTGKVYGDLEKDFTVSDHGRVVSARDRNYWGLTFGDDGDTFYATLSANGHTWLIKGSLAARTAHTIHENVECPSLSPDGTRIGYKKAIQPGTWRFTVLDLKTMKETPLSETRSIDDQVEWLDDQHLLYAQGDVTYEVNADGTGSPAVFMNHADSPAVVGA